MNDEFSALRGQLRGLEIAVEAMLRTNTSARLGAVRLIREELERLRPNPRETGFQRVVEMTPPANPPAQRYLDALAKVAERLERD
jgi:hypothetical protein